MTRDATHKAYRTQCARLYCCYCACAVDETPEQVSSEHCRFVALFRPTDTKEKVICLEDGGVWKILHSF